MQKLKKVVTMALSASLIAGMLAGCGGGGSAANTSGNSSTSAETSTNQKIVQISYLACDRGNVPASEGTMEDNWFTKWVNQEASKDIGVSVKIIPVPNSQREQILATRLASGDAPDVCYSTDYTNISNYTANSGLTELTDLVDKYGVNIKKKIPAGYIDQLKVDGKLFAIPKYSQTLGAYTTWIRKDWLDKLGLKAPTDLEELYNVLKQIKEKDPGNVGDKLIPFALPAIANSSMMFIDQAILPGFFKDAPSGEQLVQPYYFLPQAKEAVRFLNKLYSEKLMGEFIVDKDQSQYKQKIVNGELGATIHTAYFLYSATNPPLLDSLRKNVPDANYTAAYPWKDPGAKENFYAFYQGGAGNQWRFYIPKSSKNPEAAFKFIDWMASDKFTEAIYFGINEGTDYKVADGMKVIADDTAKSRISFVQPDYFGPLELYSDNVNKYLKSYSSSWNPAYSAQFLSETVSGDKVDRFQTPVLSSARPAYDKYKGTLDKKWDEVLVKLVCSTAPKDFDAAFDAAIKTLKAEGGDEVIKESTDLYKKQYGK